MYQIKPEDREAIARLAGNIASGICAGANFDRNPVPYAPTDQVSDYAVRVAVDIYDQIDWIIEKNKKAKLKKPLP